MKTSKDECWDAIGLQAEKDRIWKEAIERFLEIYRHSGTSEEVERRIRNLKMGDGEPKRGDGGREVTLLQAADALAKSAEMLWVVLANVSEGDWKKQPQEWQDAAARWRDEYHKALAAYEKVRIK
jgi:hypothetical protein